MSDIFDLAIIDGLSRCYVANHLSLSVLDRQPVLTEESLREIELCAGDNQFFSITVFDEYDDAEIQNPVLWLHLIIDTCRAFEESKDYSEWLQNEGYENNNFYKSLYQQYSVVVPEIRKIIGDIKTIDYHHIEFNTNIARALREYR